MLGALLNTNQTKTVAVFEENGATVLAREGDYLKYGLRIIKIRSAKRVKFFCGGEYIEYLFWGKPKVDDETQNTDEFQTEDTFEYKDEHSYD